MKITIIKTCGVSGKKILHYLNSVGGDASYVFLDNDSKKWGIDVEGIHVYSFFDLPALSLDNVKSLIIPDKFYDKQELHDLENIGISREKIFVFSEEKYVSGENPLVQVDEFVVLPYIQYHVCDHCNLNCKGCGHFSPLVDGEVFASLKQFKSDIRQLKKLIPYINMIRIMGGEPLLNNELSEFVSETRKVYPYADIRLVTNGILLNSLEDSVWNVLRDNEIKVDISAYPVCYTNVTEYVNLVKEHGVEIGMVWKVTHFGVNLQPKDEYTWQTTEMCTCNTLCDGTIATCTKPYYAKYYNEYFNRDLPLEDGKIDLYDERLTGKKLLEKLNRPIELCQYCFTWKWKLQNPYDTKGYYKEWGCYKGDTCVESDWYPDEM